MIKIIYQRGYRVNFKILLPFISALKKISPYIMSFILIFFICGVFLIFFIFLLWQCINCWKKISNIQKIFNKYRLDNIWQNFEHLNEELSKNKFIEPFWRKFNESLLKTGNFEDKGKVYSTIGANYLFNEVNLIYSCINIQIYKAVPSILTGLGILGTFLGLILGLSQIDLATSDINVLKNGIKGLLSGASMAFSTSLVGISLSILFLFIKRSIMSSLSKKIIKLQSTIDNLFIYKSPESILYDIFDNIKEQTDELKKFNTELAISIANALDEKLASSLTPTFEKLLNAIKELTKTGVSQLSKSITEEARTEIENLKVVLNSAAITLEETINNSQKNQQQTTEIFNGFLKEVQKHQDAFYNNIKETISNLIDKVEQTTSTQQEQLNNMTSKSIETLLQLMEQFSTNISKLVNNLEHQSNNIYQEMDTKIKELSSLIKERFEEISKQQKTEREQLDLMLKQLNTTLVQIEDIMKDAGLVAEEFSSSVKPIKEASENLFKSIQDIKNQYEYIKNTFDDSHELLKNHLSLIRDSVTSLLEATSHTQRAWSAYENKFGQIREDLEIIFNEISKGLKEYAEITGRNLSNVLGEFDDQLSKAVERIGGAVQDLKELHEIFIEEVEQLKQAKK